MEEAEERVIGFHFEKHIDFNTCNSVSLLHSPNIYDASDTRIGTSFSQECQFSSSKSNSPWFFIDYINSYYYYSSQKKCFDNYP